MSSLKNQKKKLKIKAFASNGRPDDKKNFWDACRAISDFKAKYKKKKLEKDTFHYENSFRKNRWEFSKRAIKGTLEAISQGPSFTKTTADAYFKGTYEKEKIVDKNELKWIHGPEVNPQMENFVKFDESPITPRQIRETLKYCNKNSAPGPDGINFGILHKLNYLHGILATLFTKVFQNGSPPSAWSESIIKLIHKKGSTEDPSNFRMISLSNTIGKLFHLIISKRTTNYVISNKMIDPFLQKGFIPGINGCVDHNLVMDEIIKDAKMKRRTVHITFFDLADAFGSVPHQLILYTFKRLHMP